MVTAYFDYASNMNPENNRLLFWVKSCENTMKLSIFLVLMENSFYSVTVC